jgi:hypothetical protein
VKIDWDRYVDEDEEEDGFDTSAVSLRFNLSFRRQQIIHFCSYAHPHFLLKIA